MQVLALPPTSNLKKVKTLEPFLTSMPVPPPLWCNRAIRANLASEPSRECGQVMSSPKKLWQELQLDHIRMFKKYVWKAEATCFQEERLYFNEPSLLQKTALQRDATWGIPLSIPEPGSLAHFGEWWYEITECNLKSKMIEHTKWFPSVCLQKYH